MTNYQQIVNFTVGEVEYGVPVHQVREVRDIENVTPVPGSPDWIDGVTNLRGQIITILDLRKRLSLPEEEGRRDKIIVVESPKCAVGVVVDTVTEVSNIENDDIENNLVLNSENKSYILGVGKLGDRLVVLLDLYKIVKDVDSVIDMTQYTEMLVPA